MCNQVRPLIENVDHEWPHMGHMFNAHLTDDDDILTRRNSFRPIGQTNSFLCNFSMLDPHTKHKQHCSNHYGCVLWDLTNSKLEDYCIAWRKGVRKMRSLPYMILAA
jgi:hypothetical protein